MIGPLLLIISLLVASTSAQATSNLLSVLLSEGISLFTSITANIATATPTPTPTSLSTRTSNSAAASSSASVRQSITSDASSAASSISTRLASESASISSQLSSALASISSQSSAALNSITSSPTGTAAAASATSSSASPTSGTSGSHRDRNLAIILGTVLGALALGLLILLLLILCRRRRRRAAGARSVSLSSTSDEALTSHKTPLTSSTPAAAALASRRSRSLNRRSNNAVPPMTQRSNYDVPSAHEFRGNNTAPFVPNSTGPARSSGILPTNNNGLTGHTPTHSGTGLNSHPYNDNFHPASMIAAGAGGAALGAAASRHSRSGERRSGERFYSRNHSGESLTKRHSRSGERLPDPVVSGSATHPAYWDEPTPPRSPHRSSVDGARRRSGSGPRAAYPGSHQPTTSPLRNDMSAVAAGGLAGAAAGTAANHAGHRGHERGRSLGSTNPIYDYSTNSTVPSGQYAAPNYPVARGSNNPFNRHSPASNVPVTAMGGAPVHSDESRSHSRTHPPIPQALVIPNPQARRNLPSRSPKRTRFAGEHNEPMPYDDIRQSRNVVSPPLDSNRNSTYAPPSAGTGRNDDPVSPISPEDMTRGFNNAPFPSTSTRANYIDRPRGRSRSPDFTHTVHLPTTTTTTTMRSKPNPNPVSHPQPRPTRPDQQRQNSGLVDAVSNSPTQTYQAYSPVDELSRTTSKPLSRKPVAHSPYNANTNDNGATNGNGAGPYMTSNRKSEDDAWWRGQEDSAWRKSYTGTPTGTDSAFHAR